VNSDDWFNLKEKFNIPFCSQYSLLSSMFLMILRVRGATAVANKRHDVYPGHWHSNHIL